MEAALIQTSKLSLLDKWKSVDYTHNQPNRIWMHRPAKYTSVICFNQNDILRICWHVLMITICITGQGCGTYKIFLDNTAEILTVNNINSYANFTCHTYITQHWTSKQLGLITHYKSYPKINLNNNVTMEKHWLNHGTVPAILIDMPTSHFCTHCTQAWHSNKWYYNHIANLTRN